VVTDVAQVSELFVYNIATDIPCVDTGYVPSIFAETDPSATPTTTRATDITCGVRYHTSPLANMKLSEPYSSHQTKYFELQVKINKEFIVSTINRKVALFPGLLNILSLTY
jgi:hypothetical protein